MNDHLLNISQGQYKDRDSFGHKDNIWKAPRKCSETNSVIKPETLPYGTVCLDIDIPVDE